MPTKLTLYAIKPPDGRLLDFDTHKLHDPSEFPSCNLYTANRKVAEDALKDAPSGSFIIEDFILIPGHY
jgi:hypothetical protein